MSLNNAPTSLFTTWSMVTSSLQMGTAIKVTPTGIMTERLCDFWKNYLSGFISVARSVWSFSSTYQVWQFHHDSPLNYQSLGTVTQFIHSHNPQNKLHVFHMQMYWKGNILELTKNFSCLINITSICCTTVARKSFIRTPDISIIRNCSCHSRNLSKIINYNMFTHNIAQPIWNKNSCGPPFLPTTGCKHLSQIKLNTDPESIS